MTFDSTTWWWVLAIALILVGIVGTFLPAIPGVAAVFAGMVLAAWIDDFQRIGWLPLVALGALTALSFVVDIVSGLVGAQRVGASRLALFGSAVGAVIGLFFGLVGIVMGPFIGAVVGELMAQRRVADAARVGLATWIGLLLGALAKIALVFAMLAVFVTTYFL